MSVEPDYACAILEDWEGHLLLEHRPEGARLAAGQLTCFGGRREVGETAEECLQRELREELNWEPRKLRKAVELWVGGRFIAQFYHATLDVTLAQLQPVPQHHPRLVTRTELDRLPISRWHATVLEAWLHGRDVVKIDE